MNKRIISILLVLGLSLASASCMSSKKEESKSTTAEAEISKTTETEPAATETSGTEEVVETETTTTSAETEKTEATTLNPDIEPADDRPLREVVPEDFSDIKNVTYIEAVPESTEGLTEGPKYYKYATGVVAVKYQGSESFPGGVLYISNIRCTVSSKASPMDDLYFWQVDDDWAVKNAMEKFCQDKGISQKDLGFYKVYLQSIGDIYFSSVRFCSVETQRNHEKDGDIYYFKK